MDIVQANSPADIEDIRRLFREYENFLNVDLSFQSFETELSGLPGFYAPPSGTLLLAKDESMAVGCGALRPFGETGTRTCEMKRLYVRPGARGTGLGRNLAESLILKAGRLGYQTMVLDTLQRLDSAVRLYESLGFQETEPYYANPLPGVMFWKLNLRSYL